SGKPGHAERQPAARQSKEKRTERLARVAERGPRVPREPKRRVVPRSTLKGPWAYVLPVDHGVRTDESGHGHFRAPRFHGEHNGLDLLAPLGTPVFASCSGMVTAGNSPSFGTWVRVVCPVPSSLLKGQQKPHASIFYAHLDRAHVPREVWSRVRKGAKFG